LEDALSTGIGSPAARAKASCGAGCLALEQGDYAAATAYLESALAAFRATDDRVGEALTLTYLGHVARDQGDLSRARGLHEEALALRRVLGHRRGITVSLHNLAYLANLQGDYDQAERQLTESVAEFRALQDPFSLGAALSSLADVVMRRGDHARAIGIVEETLPLLRELDDPSATAILLVTWGESLRGLADARGASAQYEAALEMFRQAGHQRGEAAALSGLAAAALDAGEVGRALPLLAESLGLLGPTGDRELLVGVLEEVGRAAVALSMPDRTARMFGAAAALRAAAGAARSVAAEAIHQRTTATARTVAGAEAFAAAETAGRELPLDRAIAEAIETAMLPVKVAAPVLLAPAPQPAPAPAADLTPREREVLRLLADGKSNQEIADALSISLLTAKTHVTRILAKLDLPSRSSAAAYALRHGLA
jgi:DNA-binding NarL/FixJ family response regulator